MNTNENTHEITQDDLDILLICAERYIIKGGQLSPELVPGIIRRALPSLYNDTVQTLIFDLEHSLHYADSTDPLHERTGGNRPLWVKLLSSLVLEKERRQQAGLWHLPSPRSTTPITFDGGEL